MLFQWPAQDATEGGFFRVKETSARMRLADRPQSEPMPHRGRLSSLDAFRGFIMLAMASSGLGLPQVAKHFPDNATWQFLGGQFVHSEWVGCTFWDLIHPAFVFTVGVSMVYSNARRQTQESRGAMFCHALRRSCMLIVLGLLIASEPGVRNNFLLINVLSQIGLGYMFLYLISGWANKGLLVTAVLILAGDWALFAAYPIPAADFDFVGVGVPHDWPHLKGFEAHWDKNTNIAAAFDQLVFNWFRSDSRFLYQSGGYTTLNFIPALATMIFGLLVGRLLRGDCSARRKFVRLACAGLCCLAAGAGIADLGMCPLVKRLWTPSWTIYSTGWVLLMFSAFYGVQDALGYCQGDGPLHVVGMNSLLTYYLARFLNAANDFPVEGVLASLFGQPSGNNGLFAWEISLPVFMATAGVLAVVVLCRWLHRCKVFIVL